jgi:phosphonate transport system permease protein
MRGWFQDPVWGSILALGLLTPLAIWQLDLSIEALVSSNTVDQISFLMRSGFPPRFSGMAWSEWLRGAGVTTAMSILALALAGSLSLPLAYAATRIQDNELRNRWVQRLLRRLAQGLVRFVLLILRSVPAPIWALLALFVIFPGILPGAIALALYATGVLGRLMAEVLDTIDLRPFYALKHAGAAAPQAHLYGSLPIAMNRFITLILVRWEELIRSTVVVGLVGAGGLGLILTQQLSSFDYAGVHATLWVFILLTIVVDWLSLNIRRPLRQAN